MFVISCCCCCGGAIGLFRLVESSANVYHFLGIAADGKAMLCLSNFRNIDLGVFTNPPARYILWSWFVLLFTCHTMTDRTESQPHHRRINRKIWKIEKQLLVKYFIRDCQRSNRPFCSRLLEGRQKSLPAFEYLSSALLRTRWRIRAKN